MNTLTELLLAFIGTNIDNFLFITLMLATARTGRERRSVVLSQYAGLAVLVGVSLAGTAVLRSLPAQVIRALGFIPMLIGVRGLIRARKANGGGEDAPSDGAPGFGTLLALNLSNGMDNISVYIPLFERLTGVRSLGLLAVVFALMLMLWCLLARRIAALPAVRRTVERHSAVLVPAVYVLLGVYILLR